MGETVMDRVDQELRDAGLHAVTPGSVKRLMRERDEARAEVERLRGFALAVIRAEFENPSEEGERIMAAAEDAGLVTVMIHATDQDAAACEVCREWSSGVAGDWHYELTRAYK